MADQHGAPTPNLDIHGLTHLGPIHWNLTLPRLIEEAVRRNEGQLAEEGPFVVSTGEHTGRSPNDKFVVKDPTHEKNVWWGSVNRPISEEAFDRLFHRVRSYLQGREVFVQDVYGGADPEYRVKVRVITEQAWHNLFAQHLFIVPEERQAPGAFDPEYTIVQVPRFKADPELDETNSSTFILLNFARKLILIGGTLYAGEIKKSIFTLLNYLLPLRNTLSMHCSANIGSEDDVALFFGLSGTGKTTLSADPERALIGDDEHGWSDRGIFNFEGGCYAKVIKLREEAEPQIYATTRRFGTVLENVVLDPVTREIDLDDGSLTENTRGAYPLDFIDDAKSDGSGDHPKNLFMLTCDAFGVMPPIAKLSPEQAMYHFLSGYTAKVAGTEKGQGNEPVATFSTCFGAPFLVHAPSVYAKMLGEKIRQHGTQCWLINTGWSGGPYGVGQRMQISHTRAMIRAALSGQLAQVPTTDDPIFGLAVPQSCEGVPSDVLTPKSTWKDGAEYDRIAEDLASRFRENFKAFEEQVSPEIKSAAPKGGQAVG